MKEEHAFTSDGFPCNAKPFLKRMRELLDEAETNSIEYLTNYPEKYYAFRACLLIINQMTFGQLSVIHLFDAAENIVHHFTNEQNDVWYGLSDTWDMNYFDGNIAIYPVVNGVTDTEFWLTLNDKDEVVVRTSHYIE